MRVILFPLLLILLISCTDKGTKSHKNKSLVKELPTDSVIIVNEKQDTALKLETTSENHFLKDSLILRYKHFLSNQKSIPKEISIDEFLEMKLPTEGEFVDITMKCQDSLPVYPDELFCLLFDNFKTLPLYDSLIFNPEAY